MALPHKSQLWKDKARDLDRYRWLLLRQRHGVLGSAIRFSRDAMRDLFFGFLAYKQLQSKHKLPITNTENCDFLLLQSSPKVIQLQRKKKLIHQLNDQKYKIIEIAQYKPLVTAKKRLFLLPPQPVPIRYLSYAAYAEWLINRYNPKILLNDRNGSLLSPFLRLSLNLRDNILVHLAHATTLESSRRLSMMDYDYYFLFGKSSLDALSARTLRFGTTQAILTGSHMIDKAYDLPAKKDPQKNILILGVGPDKEKTTPYINTYALLKSWATKNQDYTVSIKAHPRSSLLFWNEATTTAKNIVILPQETTLPAALQNADIVINIISNAVIEAALTKRAIIYVNTIDNTDIFDQERFFGQRIYCEQELSNRIDYIEKNYQNSVNASIDFANFHLHNGCLGLQKTMRILKLLKDRNATEVNTTVVKQNISNKTDHNRIDNLTLFNHAHIINLDSRHDRWEQIEQSLSQLGIKATRCAAIDGKNLGNNKPSQALRDFLLKTDGHSEKFEHKLCATWACMHSHLSIIRRAQQNNDQAVFILEDDCQFESFTPAVLKLVTEQLKDQDWDMLYLGGTIKNGANPIKVSKNLFSIQRIRLAHAYVVRNSIYKKILTEAPISGLPIDWYFSESLLPSINGFMVHPVVARQKELDISDIEQISRPHKIRTRLFFRRILYGILYNQTKSKKRS